MLIKPPITNFFANTLVFPFITAPKLSVMNESTAGMMTKALKRTMAAELSRELSVKCYAGQKKIAQLGFITSSSPSYGLRRMVVSRDGRLASPHGSSFVLAHTGLDFQK